MKKCYGLIAYVLASLMEIGLLAGAYAVDYFTARKIGMVRFVNYHTMRLEKACPLAQIVMAVVIILVLMAAAAVFLYGKRKQFLTVRVRLMVIVTILLTTDVTAFAVLSSKAVTKAYYFIVALISLAAMVQSIKTLVCILHAKK